MATFSIIIPVYNVAPYLRDCLDSVLAQHVGDWECIAVDDGSTDDSAVILDQYAACDSRIKVVHKPNGGVASARNVALDCAKGEWILFLDADDLLAKHALGVLSDLGKENPQADLLRYRIVVFAGDAIPQVTTGDGRVSVVSDRKKIVDGWCGESFVTYAYKRALVGDIRFQPYAMGEDRLYLMTALLRSSIKVESSVVGYLCRARPGSAMRSKPSAGKVRDSIAWKRDVFRLLKDADVQVGLKVRRRLFLSLLEGGALDISQLPSNDRLELWCFWFGVLDELPLAAVPSIWVAFVVRVMRKAKSVMLAHLLCVFPQRLKLSGVHR